MNYLGFGNKVRCVQQVRTAINYVTLSFIFFDIYVINIAKQ